MSNLIDNKFILGKFNDSEIKNAAIFNLNFDASNYIVRMSLIFSQMIKVFHENLFNDFHLWPILTAQTDSTIYFS